jgi:hypothetical protein
MRRERADWTPSIGNAELQPSGPRAPMPVPPRWVVEKTAGARSRLRQGWARHPDRDEIERGLARRPALVADVEYERSSAIPATVMARRTTVRAVDTRAVTARNYC